VNALEVGISDDTNIDQEVFSPAAKFGGGGIERIEPEVDNVIWIDAVELKFQGMERYFPVGIDGSLQAEAEDIFDRLEGRLDAERSEERLFFEEGFLKAEGGDFQGRGVDAPMIVVMDLVSENRLTLGDSGNVVANAGADDVVLEPTVGALNFPLRLRRQGVDDFDAAVV
jgi:hypothetical protein